MDIKNLIFAGEIFDIEDYQILKGFLDTSEIILNQLIREIEDNGGVQTETLVYPLMFNFRHYVELAIKESYYRYMEIVKKTPVARTTLQRHHLDREELNTLKEWAKSESLECDSDTASLIICKLNGLDSSGQTFKYSESNRGTKFRDNIQVINLSEVKNDMDKVSKFFNAILHKLDGLSENGIIPKGEIKP
ncbi:hypothetical protein [Bacillus cereus]|uniref:hypothetical protein n=1 Tax=Bacillus cereus TaxID=1396 RepID=UPI00027C12B6|nr:hypothetical protein [Bacillus cereus]EJV56410.1 hypothetical protein IEM_05292 [Bacillus cereus BAG6O-2]